MSPPLFWTSNPAPGHSPDVAKDTTGRFRHLPPPVPAHLADPANDDEGSSWNRIAYDFNPAQSIQGSLAVLERQVEYLRKKQAEDRRSQREQRIAADKSAAGWRKLAFTTFFALLGLVTTSLIQVGIYQERIARLTDDVHQIRQDLRDLKNRPEHQ